MKIHAFLQGLQNGSNAVKNGDTNNKHSINATINGYTNNKHSPNADKKDTK